MNGKCIAADQSARAEIETARLSGGLSLDPASIVRRIGRNAGIAVGGNVVVAGLGFITLALNARALGATGFGTLVLIVSIGGLLDRLFALQSWQAVVKLGSDAITARDGPMLRQLIAAAFIFDIATALTASLIGVAIALTAAGWVGIDSAHASLAAIYMATLATRVVDAPMGVLRLHNRFGTIIAVQVAGAALSVLLAATLFLMEAPLRAYILGFAGVAVIGNLLICAVGLRVAIIAHSSPAWPGRVAVRRFWSFSWATGLSATVGTVRQQGIVLLVGAMLGPAAAGIYHLAERIAGTLSLIMWPITQVIFPEAARLAASGHHDGLHRLVIGVGIAGGAVGLATVAAFIWFGSELVLLIGGDAFAEAHWPLVILTAGCALSIIGVGVRCAVITCIGPKAMLACNLIGLIAIAIAPLMVGQFGLPGAATAHAGFDAFWLFAVIVVYLRWGQFRRGNV